MPAIGPDNAALHPGQVGRASPLLFSGLIDDASMFPPGNAPLDRAVAEHLAHRTAWYADLVGPLLVAADRLPDLIEHLAGQPVPGPLTIGLIAPDVATAERALAVTLDPSRLDVRSVEVPLAGAVDLATATTVLGAARRAIWWEVARAADPVALRAQLDLVAAHDRPDVRGGAKLRTGGVPPGTVPSDAEVAVFLRHAIDVDLSFKLTAGLHHAVRTIDADTGQDQHGVLNLLCAIKSALNGAEEDELAGVLAERDAAVLVRRTDAMSEADASVARAFWSSYGCCAVTEPIDELVGLGVLSAPAEVAR